ncbi:MAG: DUF3800 domain-containing protein [Planctomycetota bacterium]
MTASHVAYSDESNWNRGRYRSIGLLSLPDSARFPLTEAMVQLLDQCGVSSEFKWSKVSDAKYRFTAIKMLDLVLQNLDALRVDVLTWDTHDERHDVEGRDDPANLERMYYHLLLNVLRERWPDKTSWAVYPDELFDVDWETLHDCLSWKRSDWLIDPNVFEPHRGGVSIREYFDIEVLQPVDSEEEPIVQIADLFAGLGCYSREHYTEYMKWNRSVGGQNMLFSGPECDLSKSQKNRFKVMRELKSERKARSLPVGFTSSNGLRTCDPAHPLNFWFYRPQHAKDKAPLRSENDIL